MKNTSDTIQFIMSFSIYPFEIELQPDTLYPAPPPRVIVSIVAYYWTWPTGDSTGESFRQTCQSLFRASGTGFRNGGVDRGRVRKKGDEARGRKARDTSDTIQLTLPCPLLYIHSR